MSRANPPIQLKDFSIIFFKQNYKQNSHKIRLSFTALIINFSGYYIFYILYIYIIYLYIYIFYNFIYLYIYMFIYFIIWKIYLYVKDLNLKFEIFIFHLFFIFISIFDIFAVVIRYFSKKGKLRFMYP